jgi:DNA polymerase III alpha subunit (gram-positive type)
MIRDLVFVDCETTGLDCRSDKLVELTYGINDDELQTLYFGVTEVPEFIDDLTKFTARGVDKMPPATEWELDVFRGTLAGNTMVSANPKFDQGFLEANGLWTGHYRTLDIESYAMAKLGLKFVPSMANIHDILSTMGYELTTPDHSSYNDTKALRQAFNILRYMHQ